MALLGDRLIIEDAIDSFSSGLAEKGQCMSFYLNPSGGAGVGLDDADNIVRVASTACGNIPAGIVLQDVVNKDLTRTHLNFQKEEVQTGAKVTLVRKGWVVTDAISGTPKATDPAYMTNDGDLTPTFVNTVATPRVGTFAGRKDSNGFARVHINLPY